MSYSKNDKNELFIKFYNVVNGVIYDIHTNNKIKNHLFCCYYETINDGEENNYPFTVCLGGGGYIQYQHIFEINGIDSGKKLESYDYDVSMAIHKNINNKNEFINIIKKIISDNLENFTYKNITKNNFTIDNTQNINRIHLRVNFDSKIKNDFKFHIFELSFWLNGKISDNFTINDFHYNSIYLYKYKDIYYYLLPLELLVKTTLYAIVDFFEKRNFNKCIKYIERVKCIKTAYNNYIETNNEHNEIIFILEKYKNKIKRKYKLINDYPFITSYFLNSITDKQQVKCIYRKMRVYNRQILKTQIKNYDDECKKMLKIQTIESDITIIDTDKE